MTDDANSPFAADLTARLLAEAQATIAREIKRDMAELVRIARKYKIDANAFATLINDTLSSETPVAVDDLPSSNPVPKPFSAYGGTFSGLIAKYQAHEKSPIHQLKHSVRLNYERSLKRLTKDIGDQLVGSWNAETVQAFYDRWASDNKISTAHGMIAKIRLLCSFGALELNDEACIRLSTIIGMKRFQPPEGGSLLRLTRDQARAIRITSREHFGWDSISLAAALQFECPKLKQADIIGEWVPLSDPAKSDIMKGQEKWIRGLRWSDLDDNMVLHRTASGRRDQTKEIEYSLTRSQMTMEEINRVPLEKRKGPMLVCEFSGLPWTANEFRRKWKIVAEKAGVSLRPTSDDDANTDLEAEEAS